MAIAAAAVADDLDDALAACLDHYPGQDGIRLPLAVLSSLAPREAVVDVVVVPACGRLECLPHPALDPAALVPAVDELAGRGWEVWVLTPLERMGEAHRHLRGLPIRLQPWWRHGGRVQFGAPEIP